MPEVGRNEYPHARGRSWGASACPRYTPPPSPHPTPSKNAHLHLHQKHLLNHTGHAKCDALFKWADALLTWSLVTIAGRTRPVGSDEPTGPINIHVVEFPGGASHCAPAPANIHVTKSPGALHPRRARRIRSVKTPRPSSLTPARRHIHTSKSPHGLCQHSPETHSRFQIPAAHAHEHSPAEH